MKISFTFFSELLYLSVSRKFNLRSIKKEHVFNKIFWVLNTVYSRVVNTAIAYFILIILIFPTERIYVCAILRTYSEFCWEISDGHSRVSEDSGLLLSDAVSLGEKFAAFWKFNDSFILSNLIAQRHRITYGKVWIFNEWFPERH